MHNSSPFWSSVFSHGCERPMAVFPQKVLSKHLRKLVYGVPPPTSLPICGAF